MTISFARHQFPVRPSGTPFGSGPSGFVRLFARSSRRPQWREASELGLRCAITAASAFTTPTRSWPRSWRRASSNIWCAPASSSCNVRRSEAARRREARLFWGQARFFRRQLQFQSGRCSSHACSGLFAKCVAAMGSHLNLARCLQRQRRSAHMQDQSPGDVTAKVGQ